MEKRFLRKAIVLTGFGCNSNCVFCLQDTREPSFFPSERIVKEIVTRRMEGANWLVLTGGEASIHEDFLNFVALAKKLGYERIQTVSNGRMFSSRRFTRKAAAAGLTETTISFHGPTAEKHDALTRTPGSFDEASRGAINCRDSGIKLSFNTAVSSLNVLDLRDIVKYIHEGLGFVGFDYDIIGTAPSGRAWKHRFLPRHEDVRKGLRGAFEYAEKHGIVVWVTRTPIQDFPPGYEYHKEPWEVITHDTLAMWPIIWRKERVCDPLRCEYCEAAPFCEHIKELLSRMDGKLSYVTGKPVPEKLDAVVEASSRFLVPEVGDAPLVEKYGFKPFMRVVFDGISHTLEAAVEKMQAAKDAGVEAELEFHVNRRSLKFLDELKEFKPVLSPANPYPYVKYSFDNSNRIHDTTGALMSLGEMKLRGKWRNMPLCIEKGEEKEYWINLDDFSPGMKVNPRSFVNRLVADVRVYPWDCRSCSMKHRCPGFFGDYVKLFGFDEVAPF